MLRKRNTKALVLVAASVILLASHFNLFAWGCLTYEEGKSALVGVGGDVCGILGRLKRCLPFDI